MDMRRWRWTENLAVGNAKLDGDHRRFSELLHDLDDAIAAGPRRFEPPRFDVIGFLSRRIHTIARI